MTLLHAERNVGPYRLVQQVIEETDYDAYLFQDADDWSAPDRLEQLLAAGERDRRRADRHAGDPRLLRRAGGRADRVAARRATRSSPSKPTAFPLLHPTSIVTRDLVMALGGFASGLRFSGDAELLRRARFVARVANVARPLLLPPHPRELADDGAARPASGRRSASR